MFAVDAAGFPLHVTQQDVYEFAAVPRVSIARSWSVTISTAAAVDQLGLRGNMPGAFRAFELAKAPRGEA